MKKTKKVDDRREPCENLIDKTLRKSNGKGRRDIMLPEPDVHKQVNYSIGWRLAKGYALLRGEDEHRNRK